MDNVFKKIENSKATVETTGMCDFASVVEVDEVGKVKLRVEGETKAREVWYICIKSCVPKVGDRVYINHVSGSILVMGVM